MRIYDRSLNFDTNPKLVNYYQIKKGNFKFGREFLPLNPPKSLMNQKKPEPNRINNPKTAKPQNKEKSKEKDFSSQENFDLDIPEVPMAPKKKDIITKDSPGLSTDLLEKMKKLETKDIKVVLVNCERCNEIIPVPIPKKTIQRSELPVVPISYVHKNNKGKDQHCITIHLDHDFDIRRQRISDVVFSPD